MLTHKYNPWGALLFCALGSALALAQDAAPESERDETTFRQLLEESRIQSPAAPAAPQLRTRPLNAEPRAGATRPGPATSRVGNPPAGTLPPSPDARRRSSQTLAVRRGLSPGGGAAMLSLASVPFMIGDTPSGSCGTVRFQGAIDAAVEHPTLACSRLNISENNSALLNDRAYVSYRHFHNVTETKIFQDESALNIDRFTFGLEKTFADGMFSLETRIPVSRELASTFDIVIDDANPDRNTLPLSDRDGEFGNISFTLKALLMQSDNFVLSGGLGVLLPTANDMRARGDFDTPIVVVEGTPTLATLADYTFEVVMENETVNLSPFLAYLAAPNERFYHQGFLQIDVPTNPSDATGNFNGLLQPFLFPPLVPQAPIPVNVSDASKLHQQTLLRLNWSMGYRFYSNPFSERLRSITGLLEFHYTSPLQDAKVIRYELYRFDYMGTDLPVDFGLGNGANRMDIVNMALGNSIQYGQTSITNGFVVPLREGADKPFDMEYNLQIQHLF